MGGKKRSGGGSAEWDWEDVFRNAIRAGINYKDFWDLTLCEYNIIIEEYQKQQKALFYRDIRNDYYIGLFTKVKDDKALYNDIIGSINKVPQTEKDMFNFLSLMSSNIDNTFKIPLKLVPDFEVGIKNYICNVYDTFELYMPDIILSLDGIILDPINNTYVIKIDKPSSKLKIKYNNDVYVIMLIVRR